MDQVKFLQEAAIMGQFKHPNVIKLYGMVTVGEPVSTVYVDGDLLSTFQLVFHSKAEVRKAWE